LREIELMGDLTHRIEEVVRHVKPNILHAHSPVLNAIPALRVGQRLGIPVVYEVRAFWEDAAVDHGTSKEGGLRYRMTRAIETFALKRADAATTICEGLRREIVGRGVDPSKVTVIPNAVDADLLLPRDASRPELRSKFGLDGKTVLGFVGSFYAYEGLDLVLTALEDIARELPQVAVLLVGGGPQEQALRAQATRLNLGSRVIFTGRVPHNEVQHYYDLIDVLVYPRKSMRLTELVTPLKPLEAMAQGRLVLASDVGGHRELVHDGVTGMLFRAGDPAALANATVALLRARDGWPAMKRAARDYVETERNWRRSCERYLPIYQRLAGDRA
jgi:PEP-CTERM/exosortase A-associated glycosyltransferase